MFSEMETDVQDLVRTLNQFDGLATEATTHELLAGS
jgi:hypothetical protein